MAHERWQTFFDTLTVAGVYPPTLPYQNAYTLDLIQGGSRLSSLERLEIP